MCDKKQEKNSRSERQRYEHMPSEIAALLRQDGKCTGYIFRASITVKGVKYYAKDYGRRAFRIPVYA